LAFSQVFTPASNKAASRENAVNGFRATGMYPLNPHAVTDSAFAPSEPSERPQAAQPPPSTTSEVTAAQFHSESIVIVHPSTDCTVNAEPAATSYTFSIPDGSEQCILDMNIAEVSSAWFSVGSA
jgi:hypothetical protein